MERAQRHPVQYTARPSAPLASASPRLDIICEIMSGRLKEREPPPEQQQGVLSLVLSISIISAPREEASSLAPSIMVGKSRDMQLSWMVSLMSRGLLTRILPLQQPAVQPFHYVLDLQVYAHAEGILLQEHVVAVGLADNPLHPQFTRVFTR